ncbi:MAG: Clp protease N-terminal domain-containing protein [Hyphomicrobiaceae bacterium]
MPQPLADQIGPIEKSPALERSLERALLFARAQSHRSVMLEHLLLALTEDPDAATVLVASAVDPAQLNAEVSAYLSRLPDEMRLGPGAEPGLDGDLARILQAAASAARQSRRRQIDGAIVLAAIVGDGKSPAAGLLKTLGLTFEHAIRALQAAAKARPAPSAPRQPQRMPDRAPEDVPEEIAAPREPQPAPSSAAAPPLSTMADEALASVRARIERRAAEAAPTAHRPVHPVTHPMAHPAAEAFRPAPQEPDEPEYEDEPPVHEEPMHAPVRTREPQPPQPRPLPGGRVRTPSPPLNPAPLPFPVRPISPGEGPQRPPLPGARAEPGVAEHPIPWPEAASRRAMVRQAHPAPSAEDIAGAPYPPVVDEVVPYAESPSPHPAPRRSMRSALGRLLEGVPRTLHVATPATIEVRIPRDWIEAAAGGADARGAPAPFIVRAMSVRLRSADGRLWIEAGSPETQWVENSQGLSQDDHASWRWLVTPQQRGTARVLVTLSARSVGPDGLAAEIAFPDQIADIRVLPNVRETLMRAGGWGAAVLAGIVLGRIGGGMLSAIGRLIGL